MGVQGGYRVHAHREGLMVKNRIEANTRLEDLRVWRHHVSKPSLIHDPSYLTLGAHPPGSLTRSQITDHSPQPTEHRNTRVECANTRGDVGNEW